MKIAIVGLGTAARTLHLPAITSGKGMELVGGVDPDPGCRGQAEKQFGLPVFADFDEMMDRAAPEAVIVATPPDTHFDYAMRVVDRGAHLICEKPFTATLAEADKVISAAEGAVGIALNHEFRAMPIFKRVRDEVQSGQHGDLRFVQLWQLMNLPPWEEKGWRSQMPGRSFYEGGIHLVDYALYLFGEKPVAVTASMSGGGQREATDAVTVATLEFSRGRLAQIVQDRVCTGDTQYFEVRADCAETSLRGSFGGRARVSAGLHRSTKPHVRLEFGSSGIAWSETGHRRKLLARNPGNAPMVATRLLLEQSTAALNTGGVPFAGGEDGRVVLEVLACAYLSMTEGKRIELTPQTRERVQSMTLGQITGGFPEAS